MANSWRRERWDSLRLLTPSWLSRLPGSPYAGPDPDGYMSAAEVADLVAGYAAASAAPVRSATAVTALRRAGDGYLVETTAGEIEARTVVIASGAFNRAARPALAAAVPASVAQLDAFEYRNPESLPAGGVLVVGASATGVQLAAELRRSGRPATLSVGEHVRMPRRYRGRDVCWWLERSGVWGQRHDELDDLGRARRLPSPQLVGAPQTLDLNALLAEGVELVGRLGTIRDGEALFSGGLRNVCSLADLKLGRLLDGFDEWAAAGGAAAAAGAAERPEPTAAPRSPRWRLDLRSGEIATILWATGYRPDYGWLDLPVLDGKGRLRHDGGVLESPGLYALGLPVLRRRRSTFICGIEDDAREVVAELAGHLDATAARLRPAVPSIASIPGQISL